MGLTPPCSVFTFFFTHRNGRKNDLVHAPHKKIT
jgi:hypothetical protein